MLQFTNIRMADFLHRGTRSSFMAEARGFMPLQTVRAQIPQPSNLSNLSLSVSKGQKSLHHDMKKWSIIQDLLKQ